MAGLSPFVFSLLLFLCLTVPEKALYGQATAPDNTLYGQTTAPGKMLYGQTTGAEKTLYRQATAPDRSPNRPPNIVLVIGDDHGFPYFGFTGSEHVRTPKEPHSRSPT